MASPTEPEGNKLFEVYPMWRSIASYLSPGDVAHITRTCKAAYVLRTDMFRASQSSIPLALAPQTPDNLRLLLLMGATEIRYEVFAKLFEYNCLSAVKWLARQVDYSDHLIASDHEPYWEACKNGHLALVTWYDKYYKPPAMARPLEASKMFNIACTRGHLEVAKWLVTRYELSVPEILHLYSTFSITSLCARGEEVIRWLFDTYYSQSPDCFDIDEAFYYASSYGKLSIMQYLVTGGAAVDVQSMFGNRPNSNAFYIACKKGYGDIVQFLADHFDPTKEQVLHALRHVAANARESSHLAVIRYLVEKYEVTADELGGTSTIQTQLLTAIQRGYLEFARWFVQHYKLPREVIMDRGDYVFSVASQSGNINMMKWLAEYCQMSKKDALEYYCKSTRIAWQNGDMPAVQWVVDHFQLSDLDIQTHAQEEYKATDSLEVKRWLKEFLGI